VCRKEQKKVWKENIKPALKEAKYSLHIIRQSPLTMIGIGIFLGFILIAIFAPSIAPYDPYEINPPGFLQPPSKQHFFGTDEAGRDIFSRVVYGSRISLKAGFTITIIAMVVGSIIGIVSAYAGGIVDDILMRIADIFLSFPWIVMAMAITAVLGRGITNTVIALSIVWWPIYARLIRSQALSIREMPYIEAIRALGAGKLRIIFIHVFPNCLAPVIVQASLDFGGAIMWCAALSFIGLGAQPPIPELGAMITTGSHYLRESWWYSTFPGLTILIVVLGFNLLGDGLRDILDPNLRR
jgi:peptide/nickel transport system permease protein